MQPRIDDPHSGKARPSRNVIRLGALIAAIVVGAMWFSQGEDLATHPGEGGGPVDRPTSEAAAEGEAPVVLTLRGANRAGDYVFRYPKGWHVSKDGGVTELKAPGSRTVVSLGPGVPASGRRVANDLYALIEAIPTYDRVRRLGSERRSFADGNAFLISGSAVNEAGVRIRLLVVGVDRGRRTYPVSIFTGTDTNPAKILPRVEAIAASVTPRR